MSGSNQTNAATAGTNRRRSYTEQRAHLKECLGGCLRAIPPEVGEIIDYYRERGDREAPPSHFVVALGPALKENHSSLPTELETEYKCCMVGTEQWLFNILGKY